MESTSNLDMFFLGVFAYILLPYVLPRSLNFFSLIKNKKHVPNWVYFLCLGYNWTQYSIVFI